MIKKIILMFLKCILVPTISINTPLDIDFLLLYVFGFVFVSQYNDANTHFF